MGELAAIEGGGRPGSALAIRSDQQAFTDDQVRALAKMNGWEKVPRAELAVFFHQAQRSGLDPFARQIYLIGRNNRRENRVDYTIQVGIDGLRLIADRTGTYAGADRPVLHDWENEAERCAEVTVHKIVQGVRVPYTGVAYWSEYQQPHSPMWKRMPRNQLAKCAEAQALRKGWPANLSGLYTQEEMDQAGPAVGSTDAHEEGQGGGETSARRGEASRRFEEPIEDAEVVEGESGVHPEHLRVLDELEQLRARIPAEHRPDRASMRAYAEAKYGNARAAVQRLEGIINDLARETNGPEDGEEKDSEPPLDEESPPDFEDMRGAARQAEPSAKAHKSQVDYLRSLCEELAGQEGVRSLEGRVGKPLAEFTQQEADRWIDEYSPRKGS